MMTNLKMTLAAAVLATLGGCAVIELAQPNGTMTMEVLDEPAQK